MIAAMFYHHLAVVSKPKHYSNRYEPCICRRHASQMGQCLHRQGMAHELHPDFASAGRPVRPVAGVEVVAHMEPLTGGNQLLSVVGEVSD